MQPRKQDHMKYFISKTSCHDSDLITELILKEKSRAIVTHEERILHTAAQRIHEQINCSVVAPVKGIYSDRFMPLCNTLFIASTHLQVDYESEEEENKEDEGEPEEENAEEESLQQPQAEKTRAREQSEGGKPEGDPTQMRVNAVLQSNPAIQRYCFDQEQELWCEVGIATKLSFPKHVKVEQQ